MHAREQKIDITQDFSRRHIGPNEAEAAEMLRAVGFESLDALIDATVPKNIRLGRDLSLPEAKSEADALALVNTFVALAIDPETRKPRISNLTAGLSGPAIKPIALRMVYEAARTVNIPVIGMGGISSGSDVIEFLLAGAAAVQVGTASYFDPCATEHIVDQLYRWCLEHRIKDIKELIGGLQAEA